MSNILGNPFPEWVKTQVEVRQKSLGKSIQTPSKDLKFYHTKTPWLRLASSVNLTDEGPNNDGKKTILENSVLNQLVKNGIPKTSIEGDALAKNFILQGGTVRYEDPKPQSGINLNNKLFQGAYGWGNSTEQGFVPPPGITKANVQYYNNGSLTRTIVDIKCFNKTQFQLIDVLYLRPGYTVLLEWGHSVYLDNKENLKSFDEFYTDPLNLLLNPQGKNQYDLYKSIDETKKKYDGNYDAVYGKVSKFNWSFDPDGSYSIQLQITGMGDVIESLKLNISNPNIDKNKEEDSTQNDKNNGVNSTPKPLIISNKNKTILNQKLHSLYQSISNSTGVNRWHYTIKNFPNPSNNFVGEDLKINNAMLSISSVTSDVKVFQEQQTYITFGTLLAIIQSKILLQDHKEANKKVPLIIFDFDFYNLDSDKNYILKFPGQFSSNPNVCIIPFSESNLNLKSASLDKLLNTELNQQLLKGAKWDKSTYLGRLANIYINMGFIVNVLDSLDKNEEGDIMVLNFLQSILKEINIALGGINKIKIQSSINGIIQFYEEIPQRFDNNQDEDAPKDQFTKFNIYGVKPGIEGSFVNNINLTADLGNDMATMISVGAQTNSNQLTANATSFSNYNAGLQDRIILEKKPPLPTKPLGGGEPNQKDTLEDILNYNINNVDNSLIASIYNGKNFNTENIDSLSSFNTQYSKLVIGELSKISPNQQIPASAFIPFNLTLDLEGLSGMVLYQKFKITDNILPPSYEGDNIDLQLIGINHLIDNKSWTTQINALSVPSSKYLSVLSMNQNTPPPPPPEQGCGNKVILPSPTTTNPFSSIKREAMSKSYNSFFNSYGEERGLCARWVYNLSLNYVNFLKNKTYTAQSIPAGGNAKQNIEFHRNLVNLGYSQHKIGYNINKSDLKNIINSSTWSYGDVLVYYSNTGEGNPYLYGHTQIYVGDINSTGWSTSTKTNYGTSFVYDNRSSECWDLIVFKSPSQ